MIFILLYVKQYIKKNCYTDTLAVKNSKIRDIICLKIKNIF